MKSKNKRVLIREKVLALLDDGEPHLADELKALVIPPSPPAAIYCHIVLARKELPEGHQIICRYLRRQMWYQRVVKYRPEDQSG